MQFPDGWKQVTPGEQRALDAELKREVTPGHALYDSGVSAFAWREDCDDVLFAFTETSAVAVVHLSYCTGESADWPDTALFGSLADWAEQAAERKQP